mgnify:CR=1 FL=1
MFGVEVIRLDNRNCVAPPVTARATFSTSLSRTLSRQVCYIVKRSLGQTLIRKTVISSGVLFDGANAFAASLGSLVDYSLRFAKKKRENVG